MSATTETRWYFEHGGIHHALTGVYLGYREGGYGRIRSNWYTVGFACLIVWDWWVIE